MVRATEREHWSRVNDTFVCSEKETASDKKRAQQKRVMIIDSSYADTQND